MLMKALGHSINHGLGLIKAQPSSRPEVLLLPLFHLAAIVFMMSSVTTKWSCRGDATAPWGYSFTREFTT